MFKFDQEIIKINILSKFDDNWVLIVASREVTRIY